jgi:hypothetical protein
MIVAPLLCGLIGAAIEMWGCGASIATVTSPSCCSPLAWRC